MNAHQSFAELVGREDLQTLLQAARTHTAKVAAAHNPDSTVDPDRVDAVLDQAKEAAASLREGADSLTTSRDTKVATVLHITQTVARLL